MTSMTDVFWAFVILSMLLLAGKLVRSHVHVLQALYLPSSIIAGAMALLLGPEVFGRLADFAMGAESRFVIGLFPETILDVWGQMPGLLINVVFAALFIGKTIAPPKEIWIVNRISGTSLDLLIVSALATISLAAIGTYFVPFLLLALAGIAWNVLAFFVLAPRLFKENWVPYGLANFGQCMGMTVIGLLLIRMTDPTNRTGAMHSFGYKQLLFEPVVGGGLFTAASLPLIHQFGPVPVLALTTVIMLGWLIFGYVKFAR